MQSKVILATTGILLIVPAVYFFFFEFSAEPIGRRILLSAFQSVTPRTAGFNTADLTALSETGQTLTIGLMLIGGSPGSTAGGIKTSRLVIAIKGSYVNVRKLINPRYVPKVKFEGKTLDQRTTNDVFSFITLYFFIVVIVTFVLSFDTVNDLPIHGFFSNFSSTIACLSNIGPAFEAIGPYASYSSFSPFSKILLTLTMMIGRLEILPVLILFSPKTWKKI